MLPFIVAKKVDQGVTNPIVARLTLQNFEILQNCAIPKEKAEKLQLLYLNDLLPKLLRCSQISEKLRTDTEKQAASYTPPGRGATSVTLPQVMQLEEECRNYLYEAKNFLRDLLQVFNLLFETIFEEGSEWTIARKPRPSVVAYAEANFQKQPDHIRYLQQLPACIEPFVRMRNAVEHPGGHNGDLVIRNFRFERDGTLAAPDWRRDKDSQTESSLGKMDGSQSFSFGEAGLLLIADYPEEHRRESQLLLQRLAALEARSNRIRLLLVSRQPLEWWLRDVYKVHAESILDSYEVGLERLSDDADVVTLFRAVEQRLESRYKLPRSNITDGQIIEWSKRDLAHNTMPLIITAAAILSA